MQLRWFGLVVTALDFESRDRGFESPNQLVVFALFNFTFARACAPAVVPCLLGGACVRTCVPWSNAPSLNCVGNVAVIGSFLEF